MFFRQVHNFALASLFRIPMVITPVVFIAMTSSRSVSSNAMKKVAIKEMALGTRRA